MNSLTNSTRANLLALLSEKQKPRQDLCERILQTAAEEFCAKGYEATSIVSIAESLQISRSNIHYYFKTKLSLYAQVLANTLKLWNDAFSDITVDADPALAIGKYIDAKVDYSKTNSTASIIFASEMLHGAPRLSKYLNQDFKHWIDSKAQVIFEWQKKGKMDNVSPYHLLFMIWGASQHYANFSTEVEAALGHPMNDEDFEEAKDTLKHIILKGCGLKD